MRGPFSRGPLQAALAALAACAPAAAPPAPLAKPAAVPPSAAASTTAATSPPPTGTPLLAYAPARPKAWLGTFGSEAFRGDAYDGGLALDAEGTWLAVGGNGHTQVFEAATGTKVVDVVDGQWAEKLAFGRGRGLLATLSDVAKTVRLFDLEAKRVVFEKKIEGRYSSIAVARTSGLFAYDDGAAHVRGVDPATGQEVFAVPSANGDFGDLALAPAGDVLFVARGELLRAIELPAQKERWRLTTPSVVTLALDATGKTLAVTGPTGVVLVATNTGKVRALPDPAGPLRAVSFSPDGSRLVVAGDKALATVLEVSTGKVLGTIETEQRVGHVALGATVAFTRARTHPRRWTAGEAGLVWRETVVAEHVGEVMGLAATRDGKMLVSGGEDGRLIVWDPSTRAGRLVTHRPTARMRSVAISSDGTLVAAGGDVRSGKGYAWFVEVRESATGKLRFEHLGPEPGLIHALRFSANGKQLFAAENTTISRLRTYAIATGVTTTTRTLAKVWVTRAAPLEDGGLLFAADPLTKGDGFLALDSAMGQRLWTRPEAPVAISSWGSSVAWGDGGCTVADRATAKPRFEGHGKGGTIVLALSPDEQRCLFAYEQAGVVTAKGTTLVVDALPTWALSAAWVEQRFALGSRTGIDLYE